MSGARDPWAEFLTVEQPQQQAAPAADPWAAFSPAPVTGPASEWIPNAIVDGLGSVVGTPNTVANLVGAGAAGLSRGVGAAAEWAGMPRIAEGARSYAQVLDRGREVADRHTMSNAEASRGLRTSLNRMGADIQDVQPATTGGRVARDAISGATGFLLAPGLGGLRGVAANASLGAVSGAASGGAREAGFGVPGQITAGLLAPGAALGGAAVLSNRATIRGAEEALRGLRPEQQELLRTEVPRLMRQAQEAGVPITWAEAAQRTLGQQVPALDAIQGVATASRGGGTVMSQMDVEGMTNARSALERTVRQQDPGVSRLANGRPQEFRAGTAISREASQEITGIKGVEDDIAAALYAKADDLVMNDPATQARVSNVIRGSYGELQRLAQASPLIQPQVERMLGVMLRGGQGNWNEFNAARRELLQTLEATTGEGVRAVPGEVARQVLPVVDRLTANLESVVPEFGRANREYAKLMGNVVEPLRNTTLGDLAGTTKLREQTNILMRNTIPGDTRNVMARLGGQAAQRSVVDLEAPALARSLLHRELADRLEPILKAKGPNPEAFANMTPTQRANLRDMFMTQPGGEQAWQGFNRLLETLEAVRYRPRVGSRSEAAMASANDVAQTGPVRMATNPVGWWSDLSRRLALDLNTRAIADNLMDPAGYARLQALARVDNPRVRAALVRSILAAGQVEDEGQP